MIITIILNAVFDNRNRVLRLSNAAFYIISNFGWEVFIV